METLTFDYYQNLANQNILTMIELWATNPACWNALVFFGKHPGMQTCADEISKAINWKVGLVEKEMNELIQNGILVAKPSGTRLAYELVPEPLVRCAVIQFARRTEFD